MTDIVIAIPRFALSGGNLVSLSLGKYLLKNGYRVYAHSGFSIKAIEEVMLHRNSRGIWNSLLNILSLIILSFYSLFCKNYISTHHLSSIFNLFKPASFALVQDVESQFYPKKIRFIGDVLWRNYLRSKKLIITNEYLAEKIGRDFENSSGFAYIDSANTINSNVTGIQNKVETTALLILRDGQYKSHRETISLFEELNDAGICTVLINQSRTRICSKYNENIKDGLPREDFLKCLSQTKYFICLSEWEGLGLPNFEAFSLGVRIISTPIPSALIIKNNYPESISFDTQLTDIINIIKSDGLKSEIPCTTFFNAQNERWMKYALRIISTEITHEC